MQTETKISPSSLTEGHIVCENSRGTEVHGTLLHLSRNEVAMEIYNATEVLQISEVLKDFKIVIGHEAVYSGRAIITSLVNAGPVLMVQANLEDSWLEVNLFKLARRPDELPAAFQELVRGWQKIYRIGPDYKVIVADIQSFLLELRHWVEELELGLSTGLNGNRTEEERAAVVKLTPQVSACLNPLFEKFELVSRTVDAEAQTAHSVYARRHLHPLVLAAPFMHRIYRKPLGYAGDYEMVNMMLRDPCEGPSLFGKVLNCWFLSQVPAAAHRNRVQMLTQHLVEEGLRARAKNGRLRVYNLGCGPADEVRRFLQNSELSNETDFTLVDFNDETLAYTQRKLEEATRTYQRRARIQLVKKSVAQVIKAGGRALNAQYDLVYCAGLFDYLPDRVCQQLMELFYQSLAPGGLLLITNVDSSNPIRNIMGYIFEWWLIERNANGVRKLAPKACQSDDCHIVADETSCNVFLTVRKPEEKR